MIITDDFRRLRIGGLCRVRVRRNKQTGQLSLFAREVRSADHDSWVVVTECQMGCDPLMGMKIQHGDTKDTS